MLRKDGRTNNPPKRVRFQLPERHWREELDCESREAAAALSGAAAPASSSALLWGEPSQPDEHGLPRAWPARKARKTWLRGLSSRLWQLGRCSAASQSCSSKKKGKKAQKPMETLAAIVPTGLVDEQGESSTSASGPVSGQHLAEESLDAGVPTKAEESLDAGVPSPEERGMPCGEDTGETAEGCASEPSCDEDIEAAVRYICKYVKDLAAYMDQAIALGRPPGLEEMELAKGLQALASVFKKTSSAEASVPAPVTPLPALQHEAATEEGPRQGNEEQKLRLQALGQTILIDQQLLERMEQQWQQAERQLQKEKAQLVDLPCCEENEQDGPAEEEQLGARCTASPEGLRSWRSELRRRLQSKWQLLQPAALRRFPARLTQKAR